MPGEEEEERVARTNPSPHRLERRPHVDERRLLVRQHDRIVGRHADSLNQTVEDAVRIVRRVREIAEPVVVVANAHEDPVGLSTRRRRCQISRRRYTDPVRAGLPGTVRGRAHAIAAARRKAHDGARVRAVGVGVVVLLQNLPVWRDQEQDGVEDVGFELDGQRLAGPAVHDPGVVVPPRVGLGVPLFEPARTWLAYAQPLHVLLDAGTVQIGNPLDGQLVRTGLARPVRAHNHTVGAHLRRERLDGAVTDVVAHVVALQAQATGTRDFKVGVEIAAQIDRVAFPLSPLRRVLVHVLAARNGVAQIQPALLAPHLR